MSEQHANYTLDGVDPNLVAPGLGEPERLAAIEETRLLDAASEEAFDRFTRLATRLLGTPVALMTLVTDERQFLLSEEGLEDPWKSRRQTPLSHSFCQHMIESAAPLIITDAREHPTLRDNLAIEELGVVAYAGVPLTDPDGHVLGAFCVIEPQPREWTGGEVEILRDLAAAVMNEIDLRVAQARLAHERTFLESVLENMQDGVVACRPDGSVMTMNDAMVRLLGVHPGDDPDMRRMRDWVRVSNPDGSEVEQGGTPLWHAMQGRQTTRRPLSFTLTETGEHHDVEVSAAPIATPDGEVLGALSVAHDITDRLVAERAREEFFALVSHELRTPLAVIQGYLELLAETEADTLSDEGRGFMTVLERNSERLLRLIGDLLFAAQVEAGQMSLNITQADPRALVNDACESAVPRAAEEQIDISCHVGDDVPATIPGDAQRLAQVLDNLVSNALKFTPPGGSITISARVEGDLLALDVTDTGIGIPEDEQARLFDRFARAKAANEQAIQGVGLGLAISRAIVHGHGGSIALASVLDEGTTFTVELPLTATDIDSSEQRKAPHA